MSTFNFDRIRGIVTIGTFISHENTLSPAAYERIFRYLEDYLAGFVTPEQTAENLSELILSYGDKLEESHWEFVEFFLEAIRRTRDDTVLRQLAELVAAFASLPDAINTGSEPLRLRHNQGILIQPGEVIQSQGWRWWSDVPMIGMVLREEMDWPPETETYRQMRMSRKEARDRWANVMAFVAHLLKLHEETGIAWLGGFDIYPLWLLRSVLEGEFEGGEYRREPFDPELVVAAAARLVCILGPSMRRWSNDFDNDRAARGGPLFSGQGFSRARTAFWARRLEQFSTDRRLTAYSRALAREAAWTLMQQCSINGEWTAVLRARK